jgi:hypothetical protein
LPVQARLRVAAFNDPLERQAEAVADQVMAGSPVILRDASGACAMPTAGIDDGLASRIGALKSRGSPLPAADRAFFEASFGRDFGNVRVHADAQADEMASALDARAFTSGNDIAFAAGELRPGTRRGRHLLAHELAHVVQQSHGHGTIGRQAAAHASTVHQWATIPAYAQGLLALKGYTEDWFADKSAAVRQTVLNLFVKLHGMRLWKHVGIESSTSTGSLEFMATDVLALKRDLRARWDFRDPEDSLDEWSSAEKRASGALHFKHSARWEWPTSKVQAHIDPAGLWLGSRYSWWLGIPVTGLRHWLRRGEYADPFIVRDTLLGQGCWDPAVLRYTPARTGAAVQHRIVQRQVDEPEEADPQAWRAASHAEALLGQTEPRIWFDSWSNDNRDNNPPRDSEAESKVDEDDPVERRTRGRDGIHYNGGGVWPDGARISSLFVTRHVPARSIMYKVCADIVNESFKAVGFTLSRSVGTIERLCRASSRFRTWRADRGEDYPDLLPGDIVTCKTGEHSHSGIVGTSGNIVHLPGPSNWLYANRFSTNDMEATWPLTWRLFFGITQVSRLRSRNRRRRR